jgi:uncharacterized protein with HEPN domain
MSRPTAALLDEMLTAIAKIERYIAGLDQAAFVADDKTADAVVRNLEIIGEAAARLPAELLAEAPAVPWRRVVGLRNRIVHEYFGVDLEIVWNILTTSIPALRDELMRLRARS